MRKSFFVKLLYTRFLETIDARSRVRALKGQPVFLVHRHGEKLELLVCNAYSKPTLLLRWTRHCWPNVCSAKY